MKRKFIYSYLLPALLTLFITKAAAQIKEYENGKEKIYLHTNHVFFSPGESLFFKIYLVNAKDQTPSFISPVVYVEVISPAGTMQKKMTYKVTDGYAEGSFDFTPDAVGGIYKLKAYTTWMQNEKDSTFFTKEITVQKTIAPRILMKLDLPKKGYGAGDEVQADFSARSLDDQPVKNLTSAYTVTLAGVVYSTGNFTTGSEGKAVVKFRLPATLTTNDGLLNITVEYDAFTESVSRSIPIVLNKIDLQFMPEGGSMVEGIATNIAFKALNEFGKAADISGEIVDDKGNRITTFSSYHMGRGRFEFTPEAGKRYTARISSPANIHQVYLLPKAAASGISMNIVKENGQLFARLSCTYNANVTLVASLKNAPYFTQQLSIKKGSTNIPIDTSLFPAGIVQVTLYNEAMMPLSERLIFVNRDKLLNVQVTTDKESYQPREKVTLYIKTLDEQAKPVPSNLSLAVVDDKLWTYADDKQDHITSWLLMSSELKGKVEEPQFYFNKEEPKSLPALDLLMLTNGYRYFDYTAYTSLEGKLKFAPDAGNVISGVILNEKNNPVSATVYLVSNYNYGKAVAMKTDDEGQFFFSGINAHESYYLIAKSLRKKEKVTIKVLQNGMGYNPLAKSVAAKKAGDDKFEPIVKKAATQSPPVPLPEQKNLLFQSNEMNNNRVPSSLQEVVVTGFEPNRKRDITGAIVRINAKELETVPTLATALQGKVAGLMIVQPATPGASAIISIRGSGSISNNNEPMYIMDGAPVSRLNLALNVNDISSVTILKGNAATVIYGAAAANGIIIIESKKYRNEKIRIDLDGPSYFATEAVTGTDIAFSPVKKFYIPAYDSFESTERKDFRETVYWNPVIQTGNDGTAEISFYNSDASTTFRAIAEGIGFNGKVGRTEKTYAAQSLLSIDAKIPPYLTVGDQALIPLVIKNNSALSKRIHVEVELPKNTKTGFFVHSHQLEAGASLKLLIPFEAVAATTGTIRFVVVTTGTEAGGETVSLPIVATDKGFPVIETFSGNTSATHVFNINKMIPGSLQANLKLLKNVEGQLVDGIESMLREPHGCFEQTSSSTYPNVFILKYLKESGKSNPAIEAKAKKYIQNGYNRLIGFETAQNGFEWFGQTPPREALTAYGLLEFTDMQEFVHVDKKMLQRTKEFLLKRRDNNGGFKLANNNYAQLAEISKEITKTYIVYALTQAGIGKEIEAEYRSAFNKALKTNDGYQLAMMALSASNMKNEHDFTLLMNRLNTAYEKNNLGSRASVVNSGGTSLKVEAMALYAMALGRESNPRIGQIEKVISKILAEKSYFGYGSTQATVLALNAIVTYSKLIGKIAEETEVNFTMNGKKIMPEDSMATALINESNNRFVVKYTDEKKAGMPYNLEVSYATLTPPNSNKAVLKLKTILSGSKAKVGATTRMTIQVTNSSDSIQPMAIAKIGIPAGLSLQPWQLKEIMEKEKVAYYEIFDNYLVFYWMGFEKNDTKIVSLDLKAEIPGTYKGKSSNVYLYYTPEDKNWNEGINIEVIP